MLLPTTELVASGIGDQICTAFMPALLKKEDETFGFLT